LQHTVTDVFLDVGKQKFPDAAKRALSVGMATVHAQNLQSIVAPILTGDVENKLMAEGQSLIQSDPVVGAAYRSVVREGQEGFQIGAALMRYTIITHQFLTIRQSLSQVERNGFDLAASLHIGRVANAASTQLSDPHAQAGYYITHGAQGGYPSQKVAQLAAVADSAVPRVGAVVAVNRIHHARMSWWESLLSLFGLGHKKAA
jgi:hypothetical protein